MADQEVVDKWIFEGAELKDREMLEDAQAEKFIEVARLAWPRALAYARDAVSGREKTEAEIISLALEMWELTLCCVWKTLQQIPDGTDKIGNLSN